MIYIYIHMMYIYTPLCIYIDMYYMCVYTCLQQRPTAALLLTMAMRRSLEGWTLRFVTLALRSTALFLRLHSRGFRGSGTLWSLSHQTGRANSRQLKRGQP